jgi:hypothetical protein
MPDYVIKTSDLDAEFNIGKNTRVTRLAAIGLYPDRLHKEGKSYWLTQAQYELFVDFDNYIRETGSSKDYPNLVNSVERVESIEQEECGDLVTVMGNNIAHNSGNSDLDPFTETFVTGGSSSHTDELLVRQITANAKHRATSILIAESAIANRYLQNPNLLDPELRAQIDSIPIPKIDPKELAASLIRGVENLTGVA